MFQISELPVFPSYERENWILKSNLEYRPNKNNFRNKVNKWFEKKGINSVNWDSLEFNSYMGN